MTTDNNVTHIPCQSCDGWQVAQAREFNDTGEGYYETAIRWVCTSCGNVDSEPSRDVPKQDFARYPDSDTDQ